MTEYIECARFTKGGADSALQLGGGCHPCGVRLFNGVVALRLSVSNLYRFSTSKHNKLMVCQDGLG